MPAEFYRGVVFERGASAHLTIEGNPIEYGGEGPFTAKLPRPTKSGVTEVSGDNLSELAQRYIKHSGLLESRESEKKKHLEELRQGSQSWNRWRRANPLVQPMLAGLTVKERMSLEPPVCLECCDFSYANLCQAQLQGLHLEGGNFHQAILAKADLTEAHLEKANFCRTDFYDTILRSAHLNDANLQGVQLAMTDLTGAQFTGCKVYGLSAWDLKLDGAPQGDLIIRYRPTAAKHGKQEEEVQVGSLDLAAFMYLTLNNRNISRVIGETTSRWVLLLGRFSRRKYRTDEAEGRVPEAASSYTCHLRLSAAKRERPPRDDQPSWRPQHVRCRRNLRSEIGAYGGPNDRLDLWRADLSNHREREARSFDVRRAAEVHMGTQDTRI